MLRHVRKQNPARGIELWFSNSAKPLEYPQESCKSFNTQIDCEFLGDAQSESYWRKILQEIRELSPSSCHYGDRSLGQARKRPECSSGRGECQVGEGFIVLRTVPACLATSLWAISFQCLGRAQMWPLTNKSWLKTWGGVWLQYWPSVVLPPTPTSQPTYSSLAIMGGRCW